MIRYYIILFVLLVTNITIKAQTPDLVNFQGIARDASGNILPNKNISVRLSIINDNTSGNLLYSETRNITTNILGYFNIIIGGSGAISTSGVFSDIDWSSENKFLKTEIDPNGGSSFINLGTTQLISVPYALNSKTAEELSPEAKINLNNISQNGALAGQVIKWDGTNWVATQDLQSTTGSNLMAGTGLFIDNNNIIYNIGDGDSSSTNELQTLNLTGTTLSLSNGNSVMLPTGTTYSAGSGISITGNTIAAIDNSATNEFQTISKAGSTITLSNGGGSISDRDSQTLSISGTTLSISGGNNVTLPTGTTYSAGSGISITGNTIVAIDNSATNEIQTISKAGSTITLSNGGGSISDRDSQTLSISGTTLSISGGNNVTLPTGTTYSAGSGISITGNTIAATDSSTTNEFQTISKAGSTITLSNGGGSISDRDSQTLSISGTTLSISGGNNVTLPTGTTYNAGSGISISGNTIAATDSSTTNEIQTISKSGSTITLSNGGGSISDADAQTLSISGTTLSISGGNNVTLPTGTTYNAGSGISISGNTIAATDSSTTNEIQTISKSGSTITLSNGGGSISDADAQTLSISGTTLSISGGNNVTLPTGTTYNAGSGISISGNTIAATDSSTTNEIQTISKSGSTITLSNGGGSISDADAQTLSISGTTLSISGGNNVTLPTGTTYNAGSGISISGNTISNIGDNDASNDITTSTTAGGDLSGTYPNPNVVKIQNRTVSSTAPTNGQVLQWNQTTSRWEPTTISGGASLWTANGNDIYNNNTQNVGIGINPPLAKLHISSNSNNTTEGLLIEETENDTNRVGFKNTNGDGWMLKAYTGGTATNSSFSVFSVKGGGNILRMSGDGNSYFSGAVFTSCGMPSCSDVRYKKDIYKINNSLSNLMKIRGVNYYFKYNDFKDKNFSKEKQIGFIAQEIETIFPELVFTDEDGYKSVDYAKITPVLVEAIKELKNEIDGLRNENNTLKAEINDRLLNLEKVILL
ncbi:MAG: tail fiber domain-containing protein [Sphingobacteriales bacterium]|nr:MAG: tail fiber domain-containing protein [Sphingobacteriales bacterium]